MFKESFYLQCKEQKKYSALVLLGVPLPNKLGNSGSRILLIIFNFYLMNAVPEILMRILLVKV